MQTAPTQPAEINDIFQRDTWDRDAFDQLQRLAFAAVDSCEKFKSLVSQLERDAQGGGDAKSAALKLGLCQPLLGRTREAADWLGKARPGSLRDFYYGRVQRELGLFDDAIAAFERAAQAGWDALECACERAATLLAKGDVTAAATLVESQSSAGASSAVWHYTLGVFREAKGDTESAMSAYEKALELNPQHAGTLFRLACLVDRYGDDERAAELYHRCAKLPPIHANALLNLAVIYEDAGQVDAAQACLRRVLATDPNHARARLYLKDVTASADMVIDEAQEAEVERRNAVLDIPVTDFELSVRSRNCLKKMNINTLGDLLRITEAELLAYKNFGETSLAEIKAMLAQKGLRLGQMADQTRARTEPRHVAVQGNPEVLGRPVSELELSVRSRKCLQRLAIATVGELCARTEQELLATRNFGQTSLNEIKRRLGDLGLRLRKTGE